MNNTNGKKRNRAWIEWGAIAAVLLVIYAAGWHTEVIGTMQKGLLATGLIKPAIPSMSDDFPDAGREFYFVDKNSSIKSLHDYEGDVIFMNVWATWCPPCIAEMPSIQALYNRIEETENISFLLVSVDEEFERAKDFMADRGYTMPIYHFRNRAPDSYESRVVPTTYVISPGGKLLLEKHGLARYDTPEFEQFLREASAL